MTVSGHFRGLSAMSTIADTFTTTVTSYVLCYVFVINEKIF